MDIEEILKRCKEMFPIGTRIESIMKDDVIIKEECKIYNNNWIIANNYNSVYFDGKYAKVLQSIELIYNIWI